MARTLIAAQSPPNAANAAFFPATPLVANSASLVFAACDATNFNYTPIVSGKTMLYFINTDSASHTVTIHSVVDSQNRTADITTYSIAAGAVGGATNSIAMMGPFTTTPPGWNQTSPAGLYFDASSALVLVAVLTNP